MNYELKKRREIENDQRGVKYIDKSNCDDVKIFLNNNKYPLMSEANFNLFRSLIVVLT